MLLSHLQKFIGIYGYSKTQQSTIKRTLYSLFGVKIKKQKNLQKHLIIVDYFILILYNDDIIKIKINFKGE